MIEIKLRQIYQKVQNREHNIRISNQNSNILENIELKNVTNLEANNLSEVSTRLHNLGCGHQQFRYFLASLLLI